MRRGGVPKSSQPLRALSEPFPSASEPFREIPEPLRDSQRDSELSRSRSEVLRSRSELPGSGSEIFKSGCEISRNRSRGLRNRSEPSGGRSEIFREAPSFLGVVTEFAGRPRADTRRHLLGEASERHARLPHLPRHGEHAVDVGAHCAHGRVHAGHGDPDEPRGVDPMSDSVMSSHSAFPSSCRSVATLLPETLQPSAVVLLLLV
jgi:hypothetical protein